MEFIMELEEMKQNQKTIMRANSILSHIMEIKILQARGDKLTEDQEYILSKEYEIKNHKQEAEKRLKELNETLSVRDILLTV